MVLVDTSVWIEHLRRANARLSALLLRADVLMHPFIIGEIALGTIQRRAHVLRLLGDLPQAPMASRAELLLFIERRNVSGRGIGYIDAHLLASSVLANVALWTYDKRLDQVGSELGLVRS